MKAVATPTPTPAATLWRCGGRPCPPGECDHDGELQRHPTAGAHSAPDTAPPIVYDVLRESGTALPPHVRGEMESRFDHDFADVRIHTGTTAARSAASVDAVAYTVGRQIVFGQGQFSPTTTAGRQLLGHELTHVKQQGRRPVDLGRLRISDPHESSEQEAAGAASRATGPLTSSVASVPTLSAPVLQRARCALVPAATCAAPVAGSATDFGTAVETQEQGPRARRARMSAARQVATGHTGHARQLELFLESQSPGLLANVHGIFIDQDMSPSVGASTQECNTMVPPVPAPANAICIFVPGHVNIEAGRFRQGDATVGGISREDWRVDTLQSLTHEIAHVVFDKSGLGQPAGVTTAACDRATLDFDLSELAAIMSEFPPVFRAIPGGAPAADASRTRLANWFSFKITNASEGIQGLLTAMRCRCDCGDVDKFVIQTFNFASASWTAPERLAFNTELRRAVWNLHWPL